MGQLLSLFCLVLTANLDTLFLAAGWGLRRRPIPWASSLLIAGVTSIITWLSLRVGGLTAGLLTETASKTLAAVLLMAIGAWVLLQWLKNDGQPAIAQQPLSLWDALLLALVLAANNAGMGLAAGLAGFSPEMTGVINFAIALLALWAGGALGCRAAGHWLGRWADCLSGGILIALGAAIRWI